MVGKDIDVTVYYVEEFVSGFMVVSTHCLAFVNFQ
jgi:hypothetical protein